MCGRLGAPCATEMATLPRSGWCSLIPIVYLVLRVPFFVQWLTFVPCGINPLSPPGCEQALAYRYERRKSHSEVQQSILTRYFTYQVSRITAVVHPSPHYRGVPRQPQCRSVSGQPRYCSVSGQPH